MLTSALPLQILAIMPCKALPGPHSVKLVAPAANHVGHFLRPEHAGSQLLDEVGLDFFRIRVSHAVYVLVNRADRLLNSVTAMAASSSSLAGLHQWAVESTANRQYQCTLGTSLFQANAGSVDAGFQFR